MVAALLRQSVVLFLLYPMADPPPAETADPAPVEAVAVVNVSTVFNTDSGFLDRMNSLRTLKEEMESAPGPLRDRVKKVLDKELEYYRLTYDDIQRATEAVAKRKALTIVLFIDSISAYKGAFGAVSRDVDTPRELIQTPALAFVKRQDRIDITDDVAAELKRRRAKQEDGPETFIITVPFLR